LRRAVEEEGGRGQLRRSERTRTEPYIRRRRHRKRQFSPSLLIFETGETTKNGRGLHKMGREEGEEGREEISYSQGAGTMIERGYRSVVGIFFVLSKE